HFRLAAELTFGADLAGHARHFCGEGAELVDHRIDGVFEFEDFAFDVDSDLLGEVAVGHGRGDFGDIAHLGGQVASHEVDAIRQVLPRTAHVPHVRLSAQLAFRTHLAGHARYFRRKGAELVHHRIDHVLDLKDLAADIDSNLLREVAGGD